MKDKIASFCDGKKCDSCLVTIIWDSISEKCRCLESVLNMKIADRPVSPNTYQFPHPAQLNESLNLTVGITCSPNNDPNCQRNVEVDREFAGNHNVNTYYPTNNQFLIPSGPYTAPGLYRYKITLRCGSTICRIDSLYVMVNKEQSDCRCVYCKCVPLQLVTNGGSRTIHCNSNYIINNYSDYIGSITTTMVHNCDPPANCPLSYTWEIRKPDNTLITQGAGDQINYPLGITLPLNYKIIFTAKCGNQLCSPCMLKVTNRFETEPEKPPDDDL